MDAATMMNRLASVIDAHERDALTGLSHENFVCRLVHTGEVFDRASWVRLNAEYPGFERLVLQDCVATDTRAVGRSHVTGRVDEQPAQYEVATFITLRAGLIVEMTEVWADVQSGPSSSPRPV